MPVQAARHAEPTRSNDLPCAANEPETALARAERHVREGEARVARQREIIANMDRGDFLEAAARGRALLRCLRRSLVTFRDHHERLNAEEATSRPRP
jgi:hypothetical protein